VFTGQTTKLGDPSPLRKQIVLVLVVVLILEFLRSTPLLSTGPKVENENDDENEDDKSRRESSFAYGVLVLIAITTGR
jgi:hypothetical protein